MLRVAIERERENDLSMVPSNILIIVKGCLFFKTNKFVVRKTPIHQEDRKILE